MGLTAREVALLARRAGHRISHGTVAAAELPGSDPTLKTLKVLASVYGDDLEEYLKIGGHISGKPTPKQPTDYDKLLDADPRLTKEMREALKTLLKKATSK